MRTTITIDDELLADLRDELGIAETSVLVWQALVEMRQRIAADRVHLDPFSFPPQTDDAVAHLRAFLARPPGSAHAQRHVSHARATLNELTGEDGPVARRDG